MYWYKIIILSKNVNNIIFSSKAYLYIINKVYICTGVQRNTWQKTRGITTDELVDRYTIEDEIIGDAPRQLQGLGKSYTPDNLKKYLKSFLSGAFPVTLGIETTK